jgi:hypothetical protein
MTHESEAQPASDLEGLLWLDLDQQLDDAGRRRLAAALAGDPEAIRLATEVHEAWSLLAGVEPVEPPAGLRAAIERSVHALRPAGAAAPGPPISLDRWRSRRAAPRLALAASLVLALGLAGVATLRFGRTVDDSSTATGAITGARAATDSVTTGALAGGAGALTLQRGEGGLVLVLDLAASATPWEVTLEAEGLRAPASAGALRLLEASSGRLRFALDETRPARPITLHLDAPGAQAFRVIVSTDGRTLLDRSFELHDLPRAGR